MTQLTEQLSAVRNTQLEAQLDVFRTLTTRTLDSAGQLFALNVKTSRQSIEQATGAFRELLDARDPRDLLAVGKAAQGQWQNLFSYGREVFGIATGVPVLNWISMPAPAAAPAQAQAPQMLPTSAPAAPESAAPASPTPESVAPVSTVAEAEAAIEAAIADEMPPAAPTPVAQALQEIAPLPTSAEHPAAAPLFLDAGGEVELPMVDPVDSAPPVQATAGPAPKGSRGSRRK